MRLTVIGLSLLMAVAMVTADDHKYIGVMAKELRNGMNYTPRFVLTEASTENVYIDVSIRKTDNPSSDLAFANSTFTITIAAGSMSGQGTVLVPFSLATGEQYFVHSSFTGLSVKTLPVGVVVYRPKLPLFILTDKPVYKSGDTVLIRALGCDMELRPVSKNLTIEIKDSNGNSIWKMMTTDDANPLIDANFTVSDDPIYGMYKVILFNADGYTEAQFKVEDYVLPKFEVMLESDEKYLVVGDKKTLTINGRVKGIYSYGKNVQGNATLKMARGYGGFVERRDWDGSKFDGSRLFSIEVDATELRQPFMYDSYSYSSTLKLRAELQENLTGNVESAEVSITIFRTAFILKFVRPMPLLFQGNTGYTFQVELTNPQGGQLTAWDGAGSDSLSHYKLYYKTKEAKEYSTADVTMNPMSVSVELDTPDNDLSQNEVHAYFVYSNPATNKTEQSQQVYEKVTKYYTYSMKKIEVQMVYNENTAKRCFKISPFTAGDQAYYQIVNNYYPEEMKEYTMESGYCFDVQQDHKPQTRILVYKLVPYKEGKELVTAFHDVNIEWSPEQEVELAVFGKDSGDSVVKPGDDVELIIKTKGQAYVAVKGVDKSVSFMADPNDLTLKALKDAITAFRIYDRAVENMFPNPPMFPRPFLMGRPEGPVFKRKKRCSACISSVQYMDSRKLLENSGLSIVSNIDMKRQEGFVTGNKDYEYRMYEDAAFYRFNSAAESAVEGKDYNDGIIMEAMAGAGPDFGDENIMSKNQGKDYDDYGMIMPAMAEADRPMYEAAFKNQGADKNWFVPGRGGMLEREGIMFKNPGRDYGDYYFMAALPPGAVADSMDKDAMVTGTLLTQVLLICGWDEAVKPDALVKDVQDVADTLQQQITNNGFDLPEIAPANNANRLKGDGAVEEDAEVDAPVEEPEVAARQEFPETWLWDLAMTNENGDLRLAREVPDTITNWQVSAFGFNQQYGLSVSGIKEITVFQDFFISMNLPYSVVRTESVKIDIVIFNYLDTELKVEVELAASVNYSIKGSSSKFRKALTIAAGTSGLATVMVKFTQIGDIPLDAKATQKTENGMTGFVDRVIRELIVKPEGREIRKDDNVVVALPNNNMQETTTEMSFNMTKIDVPNYLVPGSLRMYLYVTGDMMGAFISNIVAKIRMPFGCGEQNIKSLTPSAYVQRYLRKVGRLTPKIEALVGKVCGAGVRKQFIYLHKDGSYSAFGDRDNVCVCGTQGRKRGSTWLTAYVLMTFSLLYSDEVTYVSPENLKRSFDYIKNNVTYENCEFQFFVEEGELIHKEMQGGSGSRFGFVAFVLMALMDYKEAAEKAGLVESAKEAGDLIAKATAWLVRQEVELRRMRDPYQLAIVAYTLARAHETSVSTTLLGDLADILQERKDNMKTEKPADDPTPGQCMYIPSSTPSDVCTTDDDCNKGMTNNRYSYSKMQCCQVTCKQEKRCSRIPYRSTVRADMIIEDDSDSSMIETKGYALMAYLELHEKESDKTKYIDKIEMLKKWLLSKRKGNGFFSSTQDTVVALRALAKYAMTFPDSNGADFSVRAKVGNRYATDAVVVDPTTYTVTTEKKLDVAVAPSSVSVEVTGKSGTAYANLVAIYNVAKNVTTSPFNVTVEPKKIKNKPFIRTCLSRNGNYMGQIGRMIYMTLDFQTGKTSCGVESESDIPDYAPSKVETHDETGSVTAYFMDGGDDFKQERCIRICYQQTIEVENPQPAPVQVVDYYSPERYIETLYMVDPDMSTEFETTTPVTKGASSAQMNMFLLVASIIVVMLAQVTKSE